MNLIVLVSFKYPSVYSGYGKQLQLVTEDIIKKNKDTEIVVLTGYNESIASSKDKLKVISLLNRKNDNNSKSVFPFSVEVIKWLIRNKDNYNVIHCVKAGPEAIACNLVSKVLRKPLIVKVAQDEMSDREITSTQGLKRLNRLIRHKLLKSVNIFIAISEEIENNLKTRVSQNTHIARIPNGVDTDKFHPVLEDEKKEIRTKLQIPINETVLLYVGAINKRKGIIDLLDALELYDSKHSLKVIICGPTLENINFEERVKNISHSKNIQIDYRGNVKNVQDYMKMADMFILPSYSEGLPNVLLEAGSTGLPLVATDIGGSRDIVVNNKNGYIVKTNDPIGLNDKISILSENKELRKVMGKSSREIIQNSFALNKVSEAYIKLYKELSN